MQVRDDPMQVMREGLATRRSLLRLTTTRTKSSPFFTMRKAIKPSPTETPSTDEEKKTSEIRDAPGSMH